MLLLSRPDRRSRTPDGVSIFTWRSSICRWSAALNRQPGAYNGIRRRQRRTRCLRVRRSGDTYAVRYAPHAKRMQFCRHLGVTATIFMCKCDHSPAAKVNCSRHAEACRSITDNQCVSDKPCQKKTDVTRSSFPVNSEAQDAERFGALRSRRARLRMMQRFSRGDESWSSCSANYWRVAESSPATILCRALRLLRHLKLCCGTGGRRYRVSSIPVGLKLRNTQRVFPLFGAPRGRATTNSEQSAPVRTEAMGLGKGDRDPTPSA